MNIGIVTTWFERGAAYVSRQYRDLLEVKNNVYIYARGGESYGIGDPEWDNENVTWGKKCKIPVPTSIDLKDFENWIVKNHIEIVFFNEQQWWEPVLFCNRLGLITGGYVDYYTEDTIPFFEAYDFLICNTLRHYSTFDWHPQSFYIPWGTDINLFSPSTEYPVESDSVTFFHSAGFSPDRKGTDLVIKAFAQLKGSVRLIIHSQVKIATLIPELTEVIRNLEKNEKLIYYEKTVPAPGLYYLGDVYVYPSRLDGIGLTVTEALACGLPVITSDCPPMNEFIDKDNGKLLKITKLFARADGYYWPQCEVDLDNLRECMQYYVDHRSQLKKFKQISRKYAEKKLDWSKNEGTLNSIFKDVVKQSTEKKLHMEKRLYDYEHKNQPMEIKLYNRSPLLFELCSILWHIMKK